VVKLARFYDLDGNPWMLAESSCRACERARRPA
jgi:hypothetical protein